MDQGDLHKMGVLELADEWHANARRRRSWRLEWIVGSVALVTILLAATASLAG